MDSSAPTSERSAASNRRPTRIAGAAPAAHAVLLTVAAGYWLALLVERPPLAAMARGDLLDTPARHALLSTVLLWSAATLLGLIVLWSAMVRRRPWATGSDTLALLTATLWPITLLPLAAYVFNRQVWETAPILLYCVAIAACGYCALQAHVPGRLRRWLQPVTARLWLPSAVLGLMILAYVGYVSLHTIRHHYELGTSAYDLGIHENFLWNTVHGEPFYSSIEGGSHLGVHTSFAMLLVAPIYAAFPTTETLLVVQSVLLGLAAWPLFGAMRRVAGDDWSAVVVAMLWLTHPGVAGANFYDVHTVAFAPLFLFLAAWMWQAGRWRWFWVWIALLMTVKEDMGILVAAFGVVLIIGGERRRGLVAIAAGAVSYIVLQHGVIPFFAGEKHSYTWYFSDVIPNGEGPSGAIVTAVLNPLFTLRFALTPAKALYTLQLLAPLALIPLRTVRGVVLIGYGLAAALLASRPPMFEIGFQYALVILAPAFVGFVIAFADRPAGWRARTLAAATMLAVITTYNYGMIWPRHAFAGGFRMIDFSFDDADRERYLEVAACVRQIPDDAGVLASETLVPHVARRRTVMTTRDLSRNPQYPFDAVFLLKDDDSRLLGFAVGAAQRRGLVIAHDGPHCVLLSRSKDSSAPFAESSWTRQGSCPAPAASI